MVQLETLNFSTELPNPQILTVPPNRFYPKGDFIDIICHNCMAPGHYLNSCPKLRVAFKRKAANPAKFTLFQLIRYRSQK